MELDVKRARRRLGERAEQRIPTIEALWRRIFEGLGSKARDAGTLTLGQVLSYVESRRRKVRGQTVKREIEALRRGLLEARRFGLLQRDPIDWALMETIHSDAPNPRTKGKLWATDDIARVFGCLSKKAITAGHLDRCRVIMLTGLRLTELHRVTPAMVVTTPDEPWPGVLELTPEAAKWGQSRAIPLAEPALELLRRWESPDRETLFPAKKPNKSLMLASENAGFDTVLTPRDLRVWYLNAVERIGGAVAAQYLGGHTNVATTGLYLKPERQRALHAAYEVATQGWPQNILHQKKVNNSAARP
jgi:site-specific recombinase XerD